MGGSVPAPVLAVDFGTSNSAVAMWDDGVRRIPLEGDAPTLPTAVFFPPGGRMLIGEAAGQALIAGETGRYMRALKSILGTGLFHEERVLGGKRQTLADVVAAFLGEVKARAERATGMRFDKVLSGRPVRFHSDDPARDAQAEADLRGCYHAAGFAEVAFMFEPEAATQTARDMTGTGLIVDIGGGTSDFTVFHAGAQGPEVLASHGVRLGGTDFDREISVSHVMPLLGYGGQLRRDFGAELLPMPKALFWDLATWSKIPFLYGRDTVRQVAELHRAAVEPERLHRLSEVITHQLGHEVAFAVERGKIAANGAYGTQSINLGIIERALAASIDAGSLSRALEGFEDRLETAIQASLTAADVVPDDIDLAVLVGGSSLMTLVPRTLARVCPSARIRQGDAFTAVVDGLAHASA